MNIPIPITLATTPALLGTSLLGLGIFRLLTPKSAYTLFGLPLPPSTDPSPFIYSAAGRDLALGLTYIILGLRGDKEGLRAVMAGTVVAAQVDAYTVFVYEGSQFGGWRGKWSGHFLGGIVLGVVAWMGWGC